MDETKRLITEEISSMRGFARKLERDPDAAEDLLQDALERAIRKRHLWERRGSIRSWLYRLLFNVFANRYARSGRVPAEIPLEEIALADKPWLCELPQQEQALLCLDIAAAVESLPEEQRVAVGLTAGQDISYEEAARAIGVPVGTFRSRLSRGRERLRQMIYRDEDRPTGTDRARVMEYARA